MVNDLTAVKCWAVVVLACAVLFAPAQPASAGALLLDPNMGVGRGLAAARAYWGAVPDGCPVEVVFRDTPTAPVAVAWRMRGAVCMNRIYIDLSEWDRLMSRSRCDILVHEWRHLLAFGPHSDDPTDVMYGSTTHASRSVRECRDVGPKGILSRPARERRFL